ncbi:hypothetical protein NCG89_00940 [Spongiibacter taiwanensis]|uniref:hypothetical protein n=1 Tax=Spongiibacter taiwanensis TaxID=1748242 RepID=UPI0020356F59|nr:hypothetical protein [Spongiibacter taiwanensis]USA43369.1 hypothetical protein NCG89_00940 [Spongiibacter taiwanensis]
MGELTQDEVNALETGAEVVVLWSGGNGPHKYRVVNDNGLVWAEAPHSPGYNSGFLDFVGPEKYHTKVFYP